MQGWLIINQLCRICPKSPGQPCSLGTSRSAHPSSNTRLEQTLLNAPPFPSLPALPSPSNATKSKHVDTTTRRRQQQHQQQYRSRQGLSILLAPLCENRAPDSSRAVPYQGAPVPVQYLWQELQSQVSPTLHLFFFWRLRRRRRGKRGR